MKSEFQKKCESVSKEDIVRIFNEHMEDLKLLYPKVYERLIRALDKAS